jgi:hypothetical protein
VVSITICFHGSVSVLDIQRRRLALVFFWACVMLPVNSRHARITTDRNLLVIIVNEKIGQSRTTAQGERLALSSPEI